jgi:aldehyde dehydrogenase (NAD+)
MDAQIGERRMLIDGESRRCPIRRHVREHQPRDRRTARRRRGRDAADVDRAIAAARRAFDESSWATDLEFRKECLVQLQAALVGERELLRAELIAEVGAPQALTHGPQLDSPLGEAIPWVLEHVHDHPWERDLPVTEPFGVTSWRKVLKEPVGVVANIVPWNYPFEVSIVKIAQSLITGTPQF